MGRITDALKKVADERVARIQKKPELSYVVRKAENTKIEPHIVAFHDPSSPIGEQYKIIRTNIQSLGGTKSMKTFVITSAINAKKAIKLPARAKFIKILHNSSQRRDRQPDRLIYSIWSANVTGLIDNNLAATF